MKNNRLLHVIFGVCVSLSSGACVAKADYLTPGTPTAGGVDFVWIHDDNGWHIVPVDITAGMTQDQKTGAIASAIQNAGFDASSGENLDGSGHVDIAGGKNGLNKWVYHSHTGETDSAGLATASVAYLGFDGSVSGVAYAGVPSATYSAEIDINAVHATSFVTFASLANQSIDGVLSATYNNLEAGLPPGFKNDLILDLTGGSLIFTVPAGLTNAGVSTQSLDITVGSFVGAPASVPEPSTLFMVIGCAALYMGSWRRTSKCHKRH